MNLNLLIVDDEWEILTWLEEMFLYDFEREIGVYKANSAPEALELLNRVKFDVVLTDIRMPATDGIALFHRIKENWPRCRVIFLTGFRDFDNMYELIRHKDIRYILKSEKDEVIQDAVRQALDEIDRELEQAELQKRRERKMEIARYWMRRELLEALLNGDKSRSKDSYPETAGDSPQDLGIYLNLDESMLVFLLQVDGGSDNHTLRDHSTLTEELDAILLENLPEKVSACSHIRENRHVCLLIQPEEDETDWGCTLTITLGGIEYAQEVFRNAHGRTFSAVYAPLPVSQQELPETASRLHQALVGFAGGNHEMIMTVNATDYNMPLAASTETITKTPRLKAYLELRKRREYFDLLLELTEELKTKSTHNPFALELYYSISLQLLQFINDNRLNEQLAFRIGLYKLTKADEHENWIDAARYLFDISDAIFALLGENESTLTDRALDRVIAYINEHLAEDLPLTQLADVGGFNASYLSRLFRQITKVTITEYIVKKRIETAKHLLEHTAEKIQDIASKSGYTSPHSFARAFRNATGMSPAEYREMIRNRN